MNYGKNKTIFPEYVKGWVLLDPILDSFFTVYHLTEAAIKRCSLEKVFLERRQNSKNSHEGI